MTGMLCEICGRPMPLGAGTTYPSRAHISCTLNRMWDGLFDTVTLDKSEPLPQAADLPAESDSSLNNVAEERDILEAELETERHYKMVTGRDYDRQVKRAEEAEGQLVECQRTSRMALDRILELERQLAATENERQRTVDKWLASERELGECQQQLEIGVERDNEARRQLEEQTDEIR